MKRRDFLRGTAACAAALAVPATALAAMQGRPTYQGVPIVFDDELPPRTYIVSTDRLADYWADEFARLLYTEGAV